MVYFTALSGLMCVGRLRFALKRVHELYVKAQADRTALDESGNAGAGALHQDLGGPMIMDPFQRRFRYTMYSEQVREVLWMCIRLLFCCCPPRCVKVDHVIASFGSFASSEVEALTCFVCLQ